MQIRMIAASMLATLCAVPAMTHHSNSAYQVDQVETLVGVVKEWQWSNPHTWLILDVEDESGAVVEWAVEGRAPGILRRAGWNRDIFEPGETVTVHMSPAKDGSPEGIIARVDKADGTILGNSPNFFQQ